MPKNSTNKQMAVLSFIHKQVDAHGYPPTVREIWGAVGPSSTSTSPRPHQPPDQKVLPTKGPVQALALKSPPGWAEVLGITP